MGTNGTDASLINNCSFENCLSEAFKTENFLRTQAGIVARIKPPLPCLDELRRHSVYDDDDNMKDGHSGKNTHFEENIR
jgi:hypothetical protein